jgi:HK97 gp10 family phage protein
MASITVRVSGLDKLHRRLSTEIRERTGRAVLRALQRGALLLEGDAKRAAPVDTGRLRASITHEPITDADVFGFAVGTNVEYARFVEFGTGRRGAASALPLASREAMREGGYAHGPSEGVGAQPFLFPAVERRRQQIVDETAHAIEAALEFAD